MRSLLCALLLAAAEAQLPENQFKLVKRDAECDDGPNTKLGNVATAAHCAEKCHQYPGCVFFIMGKGSKGGWCWKEDTNTSSCVEGWDVDMYDFYQLQTPGVAGCMEPKAPNYIPAATREKSPSDCQPADTCFQRDPNTGECHNCAPSTCETGNDGYRNAKNDTVKASKVEKGTITVDGDLRDWTDHDKDRCYQKRRRRPVSRLENDSGPPVLRPPLWYRPPPAAHLAPWSALLRRMSRSRARTGRSSCSRSTVEASGLGPATFPTSG